MYDNIYQNAPSYGSNVNTSGIGYFWGGIMPGFNLTAPANAARTANQVLFYLFYLPFTMTVTKVSIFVNAVSASGSQFASAGIYGTDGSTIKIDSGTFNVSTGQSTGNRTNTITAVTLQPGFYFYAFTTNSADATFAAWASANTPEGLMNNGTSKRTGTATASSAGVMNSTIGTLAANTGIPNVCALFEP